LGNNEKAIDWYTKAYELEPHPQILKDRALAYLGTGQLNKGLKEFEVRREVAMIKFRENKGELITQQKLPAGVRHWQGEDLNGKSVVVYHEEGAGDFIQFCRFIPSFGTGVKSLILTGPLPDLLGSGIRQYQWMASCRSQVRLTVITSSAPCLLPMALWR
jgi:hypothetical protein